MNFRKCVGVWTKIIPGLMLPAGGGGGPDGGALMGSKLALLVRAENIEDPITTIQWNVAGKGQSLAAVGKTFESCPVEGNVGHLGKTYKISLHTIHSVWTRGVIQGRKLKLTVVVT